MNGDAKNQPGTEWQKTQFANLVRYIPSGTYYARLRVKGKLIRRSLKPNVLSIANLRLADFEQIEREAAERRNEANKGKMTFGERTGIEYQKIARLVPSLDKRPKIFELRIYLSPSENNSITKCRCSRVAKFH